jgi:hypothetical protein
MRMMLLEPDDDDASKGDDDDDDAQAWIGRRRRRTMRPHDGAAKRPPLWDVRFVFVKELFDIIE